MWTSMCTSCQPSIKSNRQTEFANLTLSPALTSNVFQNNVLYLFRWQSQLRSWCAVPANLQCMSSMNFVSDSYSKLKQTLFGILTSARECLLGPLKWFSGPKGWVKGVSRPRYCIVRLSVPVAYAENFHGGFGLRSYDGYLYLVCTVCDVTIWRHFHVSKQNQ